MTVFSRIETIGDCRLYLGDCLEILPLLGRVDAVVTDPPYGMKLNTNNLRFSGGTAKSQRNRGKHRGTGSGLPIIGDDKPFDPAPILLGDEQIIWGWNHFAYGLDAGSCLTWVKRNDAAFGTFLSDGEVAWHSRGRGAYCFRDVSNFATARERQHPTQKPVPLMNWCLKRLKSSAQIILDPYMGSGTTGVACVNQGKKFIGIEIDPKFFEIACVRLEGACRQPRLFSDPPETQESLL